MALPAMTSENDSLLAKLRRLTGRENNLQKTSLIVAILCFAVATVIVLFGEGLRVVYSGGFFVLMGIVMLVNSRRGWKNKSA